MRFKKPKTPESLLKDAAKKLLSMYRITTWPLTAGIGSEPGLPDRIGVLPGGQFVGIEFKANGRPLTPHQEKKKEQIEALGGKWITCRRLEDIIEGLGLPGRLL